MSTPGPDGLPALFRAGDIGVSSEWRDITYDWAPILTADGVFIYSYLRDMFDNQRMLRPFILDPDGPTKQRIQRILGRRTGWAIQGPEYLLSTVGLVHVEVQYGSSGDIERPHHTAATYYVVGRLDHPVLDWKMLERVLDALLVALEPAAADPLGATRQKDAQAALRSLGQAGMLQNTDPEDLFDPDGAWPSLLPALIQDERWARLFAHLHGVDALQPYRQQARAWVEWSQRRAARLMQENRAIANQLLSAQRRYPRGGGHNGTPGIPNTSPGAGVPAVPGTDAAGTGVPGTTERGSSMPGTIASSCVPEGLAVTQTPDVSAESPQSPQGLAVTRRPLGTGGEEAQQQRESQEQVDVSAESLLRDLIIMPWSHETSNPPFGETPIQSIGGTRLARSLIEPAVGDIPLVAPHIRDDELSSTRHDSHFWQAVQQILYGGQQRYAYTEGEKKAAYRLFKRTNTPIGVVLAALRAVMSLPESLRPRRFGDALKLPVFHQCVQQALSLVQARGSAESSAIWPQFLQAYRSIGQTTSLRDVSVPEYHVLKALFERQPDECWEVLQRAEQAATPPQLSVAYLRRAISNNQQAAARRALQPADPCATRRPPGTRAKAASVPEALQDVPAPSDARRLLLEREGVNPAILTAAITQEQIEAWIAEADVRRAEIKDRAAWLAWGIRSGHLPQDHPKLPRGPQRAGVSGAQTLAPGLCACGRYTGGGLCPACAVPAADQQPQAAGSKQAEQPQQVWHVALDSLRKHLPYSEFETWIRETSLVQLEDQQAIVGTPNIFARDKLQESYAPLIADTLHTLLGFPVQVAVVLDSRLSYYR
ncbi:MAG TPA: DnaA N-terminal domain-containing protein [Herpetosiphonaceae bacterium]